MVKEKSVQNRSEKAQSQNCWIMKCAIWVILVTFFTTPMVQGEIRLFDLLNDPVGGIPRGWTEHTGGFSKQKGKWEIVVDQVPSINSTLGESSQNIELIQSRVVKQSARVLQEEHFPMLVLTDELCRNFTFSTRFKIESGNMSQMAGIVFRWIDANNYYVIRGSAKDGTLRFYKYFEGQRGAPIGPRVNIPVGLWVDLKVQANGTEFQAWINGHQAFEEPVVDYSYDKGHVGIWTKSDSVTKFHNLKLEYVPLLNMAQILVNMARLEYPELDEVSLFVKRDGDANPTILASNLKEKVGSNGGEIELDVIKNKSKYRGRTKERVNTLTVPLEDRNGDVAAALRIVYKGFRGESQSTSILKARKVAKYMELQLGVADLEDR